MFGVRHVKPAKLVKRSVSLITTFLVLAGCGFITNKFILQPEWVVLAESGFLTPSVIAMPIYLLILAMLTFLIYELNRKISDSSIAIGVLLATVMSLPELFFVSFYAIPVQVTIWTIINNYVALTLASYVYGILKE